MRVFNCETVRQARAEGQRAIARGYKFSESGTHKGEFIFKVAHGLQDVRVYTAPADKLE